MDVFEFRDHIVSDYSKYIESFIRIHDPRIQRKVSESLSDGDLWPDPLIQLNPSFQIGGTITDLVKDGTLHHECLNIFRRKPDPNTDLGPLNLYQHQVDGIRAAKDEDNFVLTTGTGSGKSLAYIIPIVNHVLHIGSGKGVQAIIVYPMNALANSQEGELKKFLCHGYPEGQSPVTFHRYTGQEKEEERQQILAKPPDIILTNYVMLELILTRPDEMRLIDAAKGLKFLVLDELHTYRGRQGADVALLVRRLKDRCEAESLQVIGTSATLAGGGTYAQQRAEVARTASKLFGKLVKPECVIGETLERITPETDLSSNDFIQSLRQSIRNAKEIRNRLVQDFIHDPLTIWVEYTFGLREELGSGRLIRSKPRSIMGKDGAAQALADLTEESLEQCLRAIQMILLEGSQYKNDQDRSIFAFRLHQFISKGEAVYASIEEADQRHITVYPQKYVPGDRTKVLLPLAFCRECGQEYYTVRKTKGEDGQIQYLPMALNEPLSEEDGEAGYLYLDKDERWPDSDPDKLIDVVPDEWLESFNGQFRIKLSRRKDLPKPVFISAAGVEGAGNLRVLWVPAPFKFCMRCTVAYNVRQKSDFGKLSTLGSEGRSTATTILALGAITRLRADMALDASARKLLSFTDNRQDASLQAGHFNDFVLVALMRAALYKALVKAGQTGIRHEDLTGASFSALSLAPEFYAQNPLAKFAAKDQNERALREVLGYHLYRDLRRGWRVIAPNLEQCGLLVVEYLSLDDLCSADDVWQTCHKALGNASAETRKSVCKVLLDYARRELAISVDYLRAVYQEKIQQQSSQYLIEPWSIDESEVLERGRIIYPKIGGREGEDYQGLYLSPKGGFGQYLRRMATFPGHENLKTEDIAAIIKDLISVLHETGGILTALGEGDSKGYQITAGALIWKLGDGVCAFHDPIRVPKQPEGGLRTNPFFVDFYRQAADQIVGLEAREHTAQVQSDQRIERERRFREGSLPVLFCSPTMELGVDISDLNVVNLRNVPPTPANYAQRSGRAGRSGQPAFVFTYCATGSPHDSFFFKRPELMVAGAVSPPRLDLANEDLVKSHIHAIWIADAGMNLGRSLCDLLDVAGDKPSLDLLPSVQDKINSPVARNKARTRANKFLKTFESELADTGWYQPDWLERILDRLPIEFEDACSRWIGLYRSALDQVERQTKIANDASRSPQDRNEAKRLRNEAEAQLQLLTAIGNLTQSDFYSYRYFASEGFLPGYNFPRLPISAYIPGRQRQKGRDEFLSRSRFLAISEFGPRAFVYHEGSRYLINRVILPVERSDDGTLTRRAKLCDICGYLHPLGKEPGPEKCERCGAKLPIAYDNLFRMQNVVAKRRDRINCDEEERFRLGYQIVSGLRFAEYGGVRAHKLASLDGSEQKLAQIHYGQSATIWRMNIGWSRRSESNTIPGFSLDVERGYWAKEGQTADDPDDPITPKVQKVVPYVEDHKNCILIEPSVPLDEASMASLQAALKVSIQLVFQLEDNELAAESLPSVGNRRVILLYESAEGGAGVLRRLVEDPEAMPLVARQALELCHYDPDTLTDLMRAPHAKEDCEAACYDCLLSYYNQRDHQLLDRRLIKELLVEWMKGKMNLSPTERSRPDQFEFLKSQTESELEREWLWTVYEQGLRLPSQAQHLLEKCSTRPDFYYEEHKLAIYVDGPPHDYEDRQNRDKAQECSLEDGGYWVLRFHHRENWINIFKKHQDVFGKLEGKNAEFCSGVASPDTGA